MKTAVGTSLGPLTRVLSTESVVAFESCSALMVDHDHRDNIHNNLELAREAGLDIPVASGMLSVAHLNHLLRDEYGEAWTGGGHLAVSFIRSLRAGSVLAARATVTESAEEADAVRLTLDVWCEDGEGNKATVGTADLALPG